MAEETILHESPPDRALDGLLSTFAAPGVKPEEAKEAVKQEIIAYWKEHKRFGSPTEIYAHLMDARSDQGIISKENAGILKATFNHSFLPEQGTGYLPKHRAPLVLGLAQLFADTQAELAKDGKTHQTVLRIGGDIGNLSGLNNAMEKAAQNLFAKQPAQFQALLDKQGIKDVKGEAAIAKLSRTMSNRVLHTICQMTLDELKGKADVLPLRTGGDEIDIIASFDPNTISREKIRETLGDIQTNVAQFAILGNLKFIRHTKTAADASEIEVRRQSGVGIGLHDVDMSQYTFHEQAGAIDSGITDSKAHYRDVLHRDNEKAGVSTPDLIKLNEFLDTYNERFPPTTSPHTVIPNLNEAGSKAPELQRADNLEAIMKRKKALTPEEEAALKGTLDLVRKVDFVTNLPMFEYMQEEQLPYFAKKFGEAAGGVKLVNIDFSNMAGGNKLSTEVGDAMARTFAGIVDKAMLDTGLSEYKEGLAVRPGGKFTLLVPGNIKKETLENFSLGVQQALQTAVDKPLSLRAATINTIKNDFILPIDETGKSAARIGTEKQRQKDLKDLYGENGERLLKEDGISIADIVHPKMQLKGESKTQLKGANAVITYGENTIDISHSLGDNLRELEKQADKRQDQLNSYNMKSAIMKTPGKTWVDALKWQADKMENEIKR